MNNDGAIDLAARWFRDHCGWRRFLSAVARPAADGGWYVELGCEQFPLLAAIAIHADGRIQPLGQGVACIACGSAAPCSAVGAAARSVSILDGAIGPTTFKRIEG